MTLDARHEQNLRYVGELIAEARKNVVWHSRAADETDNEGMKQAHKRLSSEHGFVVQWLLKVQIHMTDDDKQEWLNIPLAKGTFLNAVHDRADEVAVDYGWQDDSPAYQEYVNQMADVVYEFIGSLVEKGLKEAGKRYMDSFCAEIFDEMNSVNPDAIEEEVRRNVG